MLEFEEYRQKLNQVKPKLDDLRAALKLDAAEREIEELEAASAREGFWNDVEKSQKVQKRLKTLQNKRDNYNRLCGNWDDLMTLCDMAIEEDDDSLLEELHTDYASFEEKVEETRLSTLLTGEYDANNAILTFHAGAGGTEAQDWASMLYRMYNMWAERHGYKVKVMDYLDGDEAGLFTGGHTGLYLRKQPVYVPQTLPQLQIHTVLEPIYFLKNKLSVLNITDDMPPAGSPDVYRKITLIHDLPPYDILMPAHEAPPGITMHDRKRASPVIMYSVIFYHPGAILSTAAGRISLTTLIRY